MPHERYIDPHDRLDDRSGYAFRQGCIDMRGFEPAINGLLQFAELLIVLR
jgi:hypothetical protein